VIRNAFPKTVRVATLSTTDVQYFVETDADQAVQVITVRGASNLKNAKEDAEYFQSQNKKLGIYVHRGFDAYTMALYTDVLPFLNQGLKVKLTGHSLGAAISTLLMMYLHEGGFQVEKSINLGQPKVTNTKGVAAYKFLPLLRVVDGNDLVPLVPPLTLLDSLHGVYEHLGPELILLSNEHYAYLEESDAERKSVGSFWENLCHENVEQHFMDNYLNNILSKSDKLIQVPYSEREKHI